jgi:hypothetical protein
LGAEGQDYPGQHRKRFPIHERSSRCAALFVGFSDDCRFFGLVLVLFVFFVVGIIIVFGGLVAAACC